MNMLVLFLVFRGTVKRKGPWKRLESRFCFLLVTGSRNHAYSEFPVSGVFSKILESMSILFGKMRPFFLLEERTALPLMV